MAVKNLVLQDGARGTYKAEGFEIQGVPSELDLAPYSAPDTLGKGELEEAAVRLLWFSLEAGSWVGVSLQAILKVMKADQERNLDPEEVCLQDLEADSKYRRAMRIWIWATVLTLGIYGVISWVFRWVPEHPVPKEIPSGYSIFTFLDIPQGGEKVLRGFMTLMELGFIEAVPEPGNEGKLARVFFPTPGLVHLIQNPGLWQRNPDLAKAS